MHLITAYHAPAFASIPQLLSPIPSYPPPPIPVPYACSCVPLLPGSLGQIGKHTPEHARKVAGSDVPRLLLQFYMDEGCTEDERKQVQRRAALPVEASYLELP